MPTTVDIITQQLIQTMINHVNRSTGVIDNARLPISKQYTNYYIDCTPKERHACHENLKDFQKNGLIQCVWHPRVLQEFETLKEITIPSGRRLLDELGVRSQAEALTDANKRLRDYCCGVDWIDYKIKEISERWRVGAKYLLLGPEHIEDVALGLRAAQRIAREAINGRCIRALGVDWFGHPEVILNNARVIALVCESQLEAKARDLEPIDQLASLGICEQAPLLYLRGDFDIQPVCGAPFKTELPSSIGFVIDSIERIDLKLDYLPTYIMTIENLITFQRYVCNNNDNSLVLYSGAFPSKRFLTLYRQLMAQLPKDIEVFHWGDIDIAGYRAIMSLQSVLISTEVKPFQMGAEHIQAPTSNTKALNLHKLRKLGFSCEGLLRQIIAELTTLPEHKRYESKQMLMDVKPPKYRVKEYYANGKQA